MKGPEEKVYVDREVIRRLESLAPPAESEKFVNELVGIFIDVTPQVLSDISAAFNRQDAHAVMCHAHRLKSVCLNLGAVHLGQLCEAVELGVQVDPASVKPEILREFEISYAATVHVLQNLFSDTSKKE